MSIRTTAITGHHGGNPYHDSETGRFTSPGASGVPGRIPAAKTRSRIVSIAKSNVGKKDWEQEATADVPGSWEKFPKGSYKCNLFVYSVLYQADASPGLPNGHLNWLGRGNPPGPQQWADPKYNIPGWQVLGPRHDPRPGDIVGQRLGYTTAHGHVMIVGQGSDGKLTFIGTAGSREDIEEIPMRQTLAPRGKDAGPLVYRRWVGK